MSEKELLHRIESYRQKMVELTASHSYISHEVVEMSTALDSLLTQYQTKYAPIKK